jgi:bifunctional DNA-binding transcriptional regulator/antitoxin component of YhaV-PrlF toxin-antitoxin module
VTIPIAAFSEAGLRPGDTVQAKAIGPGRVVLSRQKDLLDEFSGALRSGGALGETVGRLRDEWA